MFTSLRLGRTLNPTAITESDPYWSCCLGNAPLRLILERKKIYNNNNNNNILKIYQINVCVTNDE